MPPPKTDFDREMQVLEGEIRRLEAEYTMFFAGRLPRLPWETRTRVEALVKRHDRSFIQNTADRFRFGTLQTRFAKFCELWERQLRQQEEGRPRPGRAPASTHETAAPSAPAGASPEAAAPPPAAPPRDRLVHVAAIRDAQADADRVKQLYDQLAEARRASGEPPVSYDRIAALVRAQVEKLGGEGRDVTFRVALKDGKVSLTVKPAGEA